MVIRASIRNTEPEGSAKRLAVEVVTVGAGIQPQERRHLLGAGESVDVEVGPGQFVMLDDKEA